MQVSDAMTRDVRVANAEETIEQAARLMAGLDVGMLPVGKDNRLVGMITDRDIAVPGDRELDDGSRQLGNTQAAVGIFARGE